MSLAQLQRLLPLPEQDLQQIIDYGSSLSKDEAAKHFAGILGESPASIEFISSFNSRRTEPHSRPAADAVSTSQGVPRAVRAPKKKKAPLHALAPRQVEATEYAAQGRAYRKDAGDDYIPKRPGNSAGESAFALSTQPESTQSPTPASSTGTSNSVSNARPPPSASGHLISDLAPPKSKSRPSSNPTSQTTSRNASPAPRSKTKINITGGVAMHGASTALSDLDAAIRTLELATNPTKQTAASRACNCIATRHDLLAAAPNCLNCGKVICIKEGFGPCTFCGAPLLSSVQIQGMLRSLKDERGREKMAIEASAHRRADVSRVAAPFSNPRSGGPTPAELNAGVTPTSIAAAAAKEHRDKLLGFQAQNARRTTVRDEAAEFETPDVGTSMWGSVEQRAGQLKRQQKVLAEMEWNARPEYERRREVVSLDVVGGKVLRRTARVDREMPKELLDPSSSNEQEAPEPLTELNGNSSRTQGGAFSRNPLLGGLIKPVWRPAKDKEPAPAGDGKHDGDGTDVMAAAPERRKTTWRRVQDDYDDDSAEQLILNGGALAGQDPGLRRDGDEEHAFGS